MPDNKFIGYKIKETRKSKGLTQNELGELIGKTESSVQKYENGITEVPLSVLEKIADALDVSILVLMDIEQLGSIALKYAEAGNIEMADLMVDIAKLQFNKKYTPEDRLQMYYDSLNEDGKAEALKRIEELTFIDKYVSTEDN